MKNTNTPELPCSAILKGVDSALQAALGATYDDKQIISSDPVEGVHVLLSLGDFRFIRDNFSADVTVIPSEWTQWLDSDGTTKARGEGWNLLLSTDLVDPSSKWPRMFLEADDESGCFSGDEEAWRYVVAKACNQDPLANLALKTLAAGKSKDDLYSGRRELCRVLIDVRSCEVVAPSEFDDLCAMLQVSRSELDPRILIDFLPQACLPVAGKPGIDRLMSLPDLRREFDVTDRVLKLSIEQLHGLDDDLPEVEALAEGCHDHTGPCRVWIVDSVKAFFDVDCLASITEYQKVLALSNHLQAVELEHASIRELAATFAVRKKEDYSPAS